MRNVYLINEMIIFNPENCSLIPKESYPSGKITLHGPASECLRILLDNPQQPVSQKFFFEQVWQLKGTIVSTNTLYQSIASIRKGLKTAGLEEDIIRTLPKQGFQCNASVQIGDIAFFIAPPPAIPINEALLSPTEPQKKTSRYKSSYRVTISGLITLTMLAFLLYWVHRSDSVISPAYYPSGKVENCALYSSWSGQEYSRMAFNELRLRYPINCTQKTIAYIAINRLQLKSTVIICSDKMENAGTTCRTILFKDNDEQK